MIRKIQAWDDKKRLYQEKKAAYYAGPKRYSVMEEIWNSITHGIGVGLSIAALVILLVRAVALAPQAEMARFVVGYSIFGSSLIILYLMSTLYHALTPTAQKKSLRYLTIHRYIYSSQAPTPPFASPSSTAPLAGPYLA